MDALLRLEKEIIDETLLEDDIPKLVVFLGQHIDSKENEHNGSSFDKCWVCESFNVTFRELQNALMEVPKVVRAGATRKSLKEALTLE